MVSTNEQSNPHLFRSLRRRPAIWLALGLAITVITGYWWFKSRPIPWNGTALSARPASVWFEGEAGHRTPAFSYELTNSTDDDYNLADESLLETYLTAKGVLDRVPKAVAIELPVFVPARQTVTVTIRLRMFLPPVLEAQQTNDERSVISSPNTLWHGYDGIVVFDKLHRYRIDFPKAW